MLLVGICWRAAFPAFRFLPRSLPSLRLRCRSDGKSDWFCLHIVWHRSLNLCCWSVFAGGQHSRLSVSCLDHCHLFRSAAFRAWRDRGIPGANAFSDDESTSLRHSRDRRIGQPRQPKVLVSARPDLAAIDELGEALAGLTHNPVRLSLPNAACDGKSFPSMGAFYICRLGRTGFLSPISKINCRFHPVEKCVRT